MYSFSINRSKIEDCSAIYISPIRCSDTMQLRKRLCLQHSTCYSIIFFFLYLYFSFFVNLISFQSHIAYSLRDRSTHFLRGFSGARFRYSSPEGSKFSFRVKSRIDSLEERGSVAHRTVPIRFTLTPCVR